MSASLSDNLKASLTDQNDHLSDLDDLNRDPNSLVLSGRQRSLSKEFCLPLPPLQDFDDHRDQAMQNDQNLNDLMNNYKSNEKGQKMTVDHDLSAIAQIDDNDNDYSPKEKKVEDPLTNDLALHEDEIYLDDPDMNNFDDFANCLNQAIDNHDNMATVKKNNMSLNIHNSNHHKEFGDIFEKIEEFDSIFGTISPNSNSPELFKDGEVGQNQNLNPITQNPTNS